LCLGSSQWKVVAYPSVSAIARCPILQRMISVRNLMALSKTPTSEVLHLKNSSSMPRQVVKSPQSTQRISSNTIQTQGPSPYLRINIREHIGYRIGQLRIKIRSYANITITHGCVYKPLGRSPVGSCTCRGTSTPYRMQEAIPENRERHGAFRFSVLLGRVYNEA
jgi:hypothetical protein